MAPTTASALLWGSQLQAGSSPALFHGLRANKWWNRACVYNKMVYEVSLARPCLKQNLIETHFLSTNLSPAFLLHSILYHKPLLPLYQTPPTCALAFKDSTTAHPASAPPLGDLHPWADTRRHPVLCPYSHRSEQICAHSLACMMTLQEDSRRELSETRGSTSPPSQQKACVQRKGPGLPAVRAGRAQRGTPEGQLSGSLRFSIAEVPITTLGNQEEGPGVVGALVSKADSSMAKCSLQNSPQNTSIMLTFKNMLLN